MLLSKEDYLLCGFSVFIRDIFGIDTVDSLSAAQTRRMGSVLTTLSAIQNDPMTNEELKEDMLKVLREL